MTDTQKLDWHKATEKPPLNKQLLLYVETMNGKGFVVGYYDEGECLEDYESTYGWTDFINFVNYDFVDGEVKVIAWQYIEPPTVF
ncbi:MAG: hypothetical protein J6Y78_09090 [Paludibacteraceae bacterium]|nr:hypothetical protein [Paludibacteraceae bacterium]